MADSLTVLYMDIKKELLSFYESLTRCVFYGVESFSNVCVDDKNYLFGLFDFNMSGTEVVANHLVNATFQESFYYENTKSVKKGYEFTLDEIRAYCLYVKICLLSQYCVQTTLFEYLLNEATCTKTIALLNLLTDFPTNISSPTI